MKLRKLVLGLVGLGIAAAISIPSAYADWGRGRGGAQRGWGNHGRVVRSEPFRRPFYYRPYRSSGYYYAPRARYYDHDGWNDPGWSVRFDSEGDVGFSAEW